MSSSPLSQDANVSMRRRKSRFTYKHLAQLSAASASCPLRVIAHIDLDAFYAQCEMVRLGLPEDQPLAVQQWQGLIAINYAARKYGMNRHIDIIEAKKLCPELIMQHVATWKEGDEKWAYHEDSFQNMATHKVSLDPYRLESRRILATIKDILPPPPVQKVEKAGIDEVFVDLSIQIHSVLLERYPELSDPAPYDDPSENLPSPSITAIDWDADAVVDLDKTEKEQDDPDWDDIAISIGSEIVRNIRAAIRERLKYTCSAGVAQNKMLAKLGSAHQKPNRQTIIRNRAVQHFLSSFKFTKIRNLGGKLGDQVVSIFGTETVKELLNVSIDQLKLKLGDDTGSRLHQVIRGVDLSEVNSRTQIKSMLSAKSFRPCINSLEQALRWLRIFVSDIFSRLVDEGVVENKRRPKTLNLHHRQSGQTRSRQAPIPQGRPIDDVMLFELAKTLINHVIAEGKAWPCANLMLSVGGFEDGITGNLGIGAFLLKGEEARVVYSAPRASDDLTSASESSSKRRRIKGISAGRFPPTSGNSSEELDGYLDPGRPANVKSQGRSTTSLLSPLDHVVGGRAEEHLPSYFCGHCDRSFPISKKDEHSDWHFARDLLTKERIRSRAGETTCGTPSSNASGQSQIATSRTTGKRNSMKKSTGTARTGNTTGSAQIEKGQSRLVFGR